MRIKIAGILLCAFVLSVNADEMDDMLRLESLFNLDVQEMDIRTNVSAATGQVVVSSDAKLQKVKSKIKKVDTSDIPSLSRPELEKELAASRVEIARLKDIVNRILIANRREREEMLYNIGCVYSENEEYLRAESAFLKALDINPNDAAVHYNLGILYDEHLKMPRKAIIHYKEFLRLAPKDPAADKVYEWMSALE